MLGSNFNPAMQAPQQHRQPDLNTIMQASRSLIFQIYFLPLLTQFLQRAQFLRMNPHEQKTPGELEQLTRILQQVSQSRLLCSILRVNLC